MSSRDRINPQQLQMLMPAKDLIALPFHEPDRDYVEVPDEEYIDTDGESSWEGGGARLEDDDEFWDRKLYESYHKFPSDYVGDKIAESGKVNVPVHVGFDEDDGPVGGEYLRIRDGHHRIASANETNPDMEVPINYVSHRYVPLFHDGDT